MYEILREKILEIKRNNDEKNVDCIGINLNQNGEIKYKIYYLNEPKSSFKEKSNDNFMSILKEWEETKMIKKPMMIDDNNSGINRMEINLPLNDDIKVKYLIDKLCEITDLAKENKDEIIKFSKMKVLEDVSFSMAALYYLGFIEKNNEIDALKIHYATRKEKNYKTLYDDKYFIDYMKKINIKELNNAITYVEKLLESSLGHLQLVGADYFKNGLKKYKVYLKVENQNFENINSEIKKFDFVKKDAIATEIDKCKDFILNLTDAKLFLTYVAICYDEKNKNSINLYFDLQ